MSYSVPYASKTIALIIMSERSLRCVVTELYLRIDGCRQFARQVRAKKNSAAISPRGAGLLRCQAGMNLTGEAFEPRFVCPITSGEQCSQDRSEEPERHRDHGGIDQRPDRIGSAHPRPDHCQHHG